MGKVKNLLFSGGYPPSKKKTARAFSVSPQQKPFVDGKLKSAGPDDDGDDLVPDGKGGQVKRKYRDV